MWEFRNGQWFNGNIVSQFPPPVGTPYWTTDVNGARDFRTSDGVTTPDNTPIVTTLPRQPAVLPYGNDNVTRNPFVRPQITVPVASDSSPGAPRPITPAGPLTPFPVTRPRPQGIEGYVPPMTTPGGPIDQSGASIFTPPSKPIPQQVNFTTQDMFGIDPNPTPLMQRFRGDESFSNPTGQILTNAAGNTFERNLLQSIADAVKNPIEAARATAVMNAVQNPAILANLPKPVTRDGPTDIISQAGAMYDAQNYGPQRRMPVAVTPEEEAANIAAGRDKGPRANPFMRRRFEGTVPRYPMGTNPFARSSDIARAAALRDQTVLNAATRPNAYSSADIARAAAATQQAVQNAAMYPPPPPVTGAPRRSVAPVGSMYAPNGLPLNPFVRGTTTTANPFVSRYAEGTWDPDWYNKAKAIGDPKARSKYVSEQTRLKSQMTPAQRAQARKPVVPTTPTARPIPTGNRIIDANNSVNYDLNAYKNWATARGYDWQDAVNEDEYLRSLGSLPPLATTPTTPPASTTPKLNPQVIWYGGDTWKNLPSLQQLNNTQQINPFSRLGMRSSYDPATETTIQAPEKMNAFTMMQIDRDPMQKDLMDSIYNRHGRSWEKEYADAVRAAPMGNATSYVRTG